MNVSFYRILTSFELKVRVENVKDPENHVQGVLDRVKAEHLKKTYGIDDWTDPEDFMTKVALKGGKLIKVCFRINNKNHAHLYTMSTLKS